MHVDNTDTRNKVLTRNEYRFIIEVKEDLIDFSLNIKEQK